MTEKIYINWSEFHQDVKDLCKKIKESGEFDKIIAISRGGLIPAAIIAYELNIRNTETINFSMNAAAMKKLKFPAISAM